MMSQLDNQPNTATAASLPDHQAEHQAEHPAEHRHENAPGSVLGDQQDGMQTIDRSTREACQAASSAQLENPPATQQAATPRSELDQVLRDLRELTEALREVYHGLFQAIVITKVEIPLLSPEGEVYGEIIAPGVHVRVSAPMLKLGEYVCMQHREIQANGDPRIVCVPIRRGDEMLVDFTTRSAFRGAER
jgi:hypothetical protein